MHGRQYLLVSRQFFFSKNNMRTNRGQMNVLPMCHSSKKIFKMLLKVINIFKVLFPKTDEKLIANVNNDTKTVIIR